MSAKKVRASKLIRQAQTESPRCAKPCDGGRCGKKRGHWGKCKT